MFTLFQKTHRQLHEEGRSRIDRHALSDQTLHPPSSPQIQYHHQRPLSPQYVHTPMPALAPSVVIKRLKRLTGYYDDEDLQGDYSGFGPDEPAKRKLHF